ncbi:MAG: rhomboid family intramembrane serine protease [Rhodobacteraceae bacterium]|nr:rhomboid family intramembrane serine protease [Paracoccaceae bacterium]
MFPIRDHNPSGRRPYVTHLLIVLNVVIFITYCLGPGSDMMIVRFFMTWGLVPARIAYGDGYWTVLTSMFLHDGWMHLLGNMLFLYIFGDNMEDRMGHVPFLLFYLCTGFAAALAQFVTDPTSMVPMVGASGAIAGILGGYLLLYPKARVDVIFIFIIFFKVFPIPAWITLGVWFALQLFSGATTHIDDGGIAYWAHVGGFVAGLALTLPTFLRLGGPRFWHVTNGTPPNPKAVYPFELTRVPRVVRHKGPWT